MLVNEIMLLPYYIASLNQEQDDDGSLRKSGHFPDHIQQV
jgi:predicted helicase